MCIRDRYDSLGLRALARNDFSQALAIRPDMPEAVSYTHLVEEMEKTVSAVLVAAGSSTRMGFDKLSFDLGGETVLHRCV